MKLPILTVFVVCAAMSMASAAPVIRGPDQAGKQLLADFVHAWTVADARSLARLFAADADLVTPDGVVARGRQEIAAFYAAAFAHGYSGSTGSGEIEHVRSLGADLLLIDARWSIEGAHKPDGSTRDPERGILVGLAGRKDGVWRILAMRESASAAALIPLSTAGR
jgi:uncharacterized protein (TIGR02246 family)